MCRMNGINVIHGGHNALRFTPNFNVTRPEIDMQVRIVEQILGICGKSSMQTLGEALATKDEGGHSAQVVLEGHLFDTGVINKAFDLIESVSEVRQKVTSIRVGENDREESLVTLQINGNTRSGLEDVISRLRLICEGNKRVRMIMANQLEDGINLISKI